MSKSLTGKAFIISQIVILILGFIFIAGLYYYLNSGTKKFAAEVDASRTPVTKEPASLTLDVNSPEDDVLVFTDEVLIAGKTAKDSEVLISSQGDDVVVPTKADGSFSYDFPLDEGVNNLVISVFEKSGEQRQVNKIVFYSKEKI